MRALTLIRPWSWAILYGGKDVENRTWSPPRDMIGQTIAIHAGKKLDKDAMDAVFVLSGDVKIPEGDERWSRVDDQGIVGVARIRDVVTRSDSPWFDGPVGWCLDMVIALPTPIQCRGSLGLWTMTESLAAEVREALRESRDGRRE